jgi:hypothetical protein
MGMRTTATTWVDLPFADEALESVVHFGNGKDAELRLTFADGRRLVFDVGAVRVEVDGGVVVETSRWDDVSLIIDYRSADLRLRSAQIGYETERAAEAREFRDSVRAWLAEGYDPVELEWVVSFRLHLTSPRR